MSLILAAVNPFLVQPQLALPEAPTLFAAAGRGDGISASWTAGVGADETEYELSRTSDYSVIDYTASITSNTLVRTVSHAGAWYMRVRSVNASGVSSWVTTSFVVLPPPVLTGFTPASEVSGTVSWTYGALTSGTTTNYDIQVRRAEDSWASVEVSVNVTNPAAVSSVLNYIFSGRDYFVRMRSKAGALTGDWSEDTAISGVSGTTTLYSRDYADLATAYAALNSGVTERLVWDSVHNGDIFIITGAVLNFRLFCRVQSGYPDIRFNLNNVALDSANLDICLENFSNAQVTCYGTSSTAYRMGALSLSCANNVVPAGANILDLDLTTEAESLTDSMPCVTSLSLTSVLANTVKCFSTAAAPGFQGPVGTSADGAPGDNGFDGSETDGTSGSNGFDGAYAGTGENGGTGAGGTNGGVAVTLSDCSITALYAHAAYGGAGGQGGDGGSANGGTGGQGGDTYTIYGATLNGGNGGNGGYGGYGGQGGNGGDGGVASAAAAHSVTLVSSTVAQLYVTAWGGVGGSPGFGGVALPGLGGRGGYGSNGGSDGTPGSDGTAGTEGAVGAASGADYSNSYGTYATLSVDGGSLVSWTDHPFYP